MNRGIYSAAMGMRAAERWMDVASNNLANASTDGFKSDSIVFGDILTRQLRTNAGAGTALGSLGSGPVEVAQYTDMTSGTLRTTGNPLDVAFETDSGSRPLMFAVKSDGETKYTRTGAFLLDPDRRLVTSSGAAVLDSKGAEIKIPGSGPIIIDAAGTLSQNGASIARLGVFTGEFQKDGGNLWSGSGVQPVDDAQVRAGALESSNVNPLSQMIELIKINRSFELAQRSIQTGDDSTSRLLGILTNR